MRANIFPSSNYPWILKPTKHNSNKESEWLKIGQECSTQEKRICQFTDLNCKEFSTPDFRAWFRRLIPATWRKDKKNDSFPFVSLLQDSLLNCAFLKHVCEFTKMQLRQPSNWRNFKVIPRHMMIMLVARWKSIDWLTISRRIHLTDLTHAADIWNRRSISIALQIRFNISRIIFEAWRWGRTRK